MKRRTAFIMAVFLIVSVLPCKAVDGAVAYISNVNAQRDEYGFVTISGNISTGSGHKITVKILAPDASTEFVDETTSNAQGYFKFVYKPVGSKPGRYHVTIGADDMQENVKTYFDYMTAKPDTAKTTMTVAASVDAGKKVTVSGIVSAGAGQQITVLTKDPHNNTEHINTVISKADGKYELSYLITNTLKGRYTVSAASPGMAAPVTTYFNYGMDADLISLSVAGKMLVPVFQPDTLLYRTVVDKATQSINVTAVPKDGDARIRINGIASSGGAPSAPIDIFKGTNIIYVEVTAQDGVTAKTYCIIAEKETVSNITATVKAGVNKNKLVTVRGTVSSGDGQQVTVKITDPNGRTEYVGSTLSRNGGIFSLDYQIKNSTTGRYTVTAGADGVGAPAATWFIYDPSNADLKNLTVLNALASPAFAPDITEYAGQVGYGTDRIRIIPESNNEDQIIKVNDNSVKSGEVSQGIALYEGRNTIRVNVTSQDGTKNKTYIVNIDRLPPPPSELSENTDEAKSDNANLSDIVLNGARFSDPFNPNIPDTEFYADVTTECSITITPTASDDGAVITVNGKTVNSGCESEPIYVGPDGCIIIIVVTAEDGTTKTYTVVITIREPEEPEEGILY